MKVCGRSATWHSCGQTSATAIGTNTSSSTRATPQAVANEAKRADPIILVQDYHFALLPSMLRKKLPNATIITFWHIPWPNPEIFGICPWKEEIIAGLLGSSVIGFHTQFHCNNFLDTVDRFMEARTDREQSLISFGSLETFVRPYPISIEWPPSGMQDQKPVAECRAAVRRRLGPRRTRAAWRRHRAVRLHQGHPRSAARGGRLSLPSSSGLEEQVRLYPGRSADPEQARQPTARYKARPPSSPATSTHGTATQPTSRSG